MNILVAFECSGKVREAFRSLGYNAFSCDIQEADDNSEYHICGDAIEAIKSKAWDLIIMHPPCTCLSVSGNSTYAKGKPKHSERVQAIDYTLKLWEIAKEQSKHVAMENPVGVLPLKPTQYVQPWEFGHPESKKTGLWLHNLPKLKETNNVKNEYDSLPKNKAQRLHYLPPSADRAKIRSETFSGIAEAMANQWSKAI